MPEKLSRELSEFELDTLIKIKYPAGLIVKGLLSELLENPRVFRDLTRKFVVRKKEQINHLKTQQTLSRLHRLWKLFEMSAVFPILEFPGLSEVKSEKIQRIVTSEYHRISCLTDKNRVKLRNLRLEETHFTRKTFELRRKNNIDWINHPNAPFEEKARKKQKWYSEKIQKLLEKSQRQGDKLQKLEIYLLKQGRLQIH